jgi:hypothetical protein
MKIFGSEEENDNDHKEVEEVGTIGPMVVLFQQSPHFEERRGEVVLVIDVRSPSVPTTNTGEVFVALATGLLHQHHRQQHHHHHHHQQQQQQHRQV